MIKVYAYVCGDILHRGHVLHLLNAKKFGDLLIVGVLTDDAVMEKKERPILSFNERIFLVSMLKPVDVVIPQKTYSPVENISMLCPDVVVESESHNTGDLMIVETLLQKWRGKMVVLPYYLGQSSTNIKEKIKNGTKK